MFLAWKQEGVPGSVEAKLHFTRRYYNDWYILPDWTSITGPNQDAGPSQETPSKARILSAQKKSKKLFRKKNQDRLKS